MSNNTQIDGDQQDAYHHNLTQALDAVQTAMRERVYTNNASLHQIVHTHPPDIDDDVLDPARDYAEEAYEIELDDLIDMWDQDDRHDVFMDAALDYLEPVAEEYDMLLTHYEPVELSTQTGLPVYRTSTYERNGISQLRHDARNTGEGLNEVKSALKSYVEDQPWADEISWASDEPDADLLDAVTQDIVEIAKQDILNGTLPEASWDRLDRVEQLEALQEFTPFTRGEKELNVLDEYEDSLFFTVDTADYSTTKEDSFLFYGVAGQQLDDRPWYSLKKPPIRERDEGHKMSPEFADAMTAAFDLAPETGLTIFETLEERGVTHGDKVTPTMVEMFRVGPFYFHGMDLPPTADEALEQATTIPPELLKEVDADPENFRYDSLDEMRNDNPHAYTAVRLREFLDDNPESYVFAVERYRASNGLALDGETWTDTELFLASPDDTDLSTYVPDEVVVDTDAFNTTIVPVSEHTPFPVETTEELYAPADADTVIE